MRSETKETITWVFWVVLCLAVAFTLIRGGGKDK